MSEQPARVETEASVGGAKVRRTDERESEMSVTIAGTREASRRSSADVFPFGKGWRQLRLPPSIRMESHSSLATAAIWIEFQFHRWKVDEPVPIIDQFLANVAIAIEFIPQLR
jgi:hypothetical protein